jgi:hypothetical protein
MITYDIGAIETAVLPMILPFSFILFSLNVITLRVA